MEAVDGLIIENLRAMRGSIDQIAVDMREVKHRLALVEASQGTTLQHIGHLSASIAQQQVSFDRMTERVERIESRLEPHG